MSSPHIVSREEWLEARKALLAEEKAFTRQKDKLSAKRRELPLVRIDQDYRFKTTEGEKSLGDLFGSKSQLIVVHFMFGADWQEGCPSCSFWADTYSGTNVHLAARDTSLAVVSNAPLDVLQAYKARMGWDFDWVSAEGSSFSSDFGVTFLDDESRANPEGYNFDKLPYGDENPGVSVFSKLDDGTICHSYSAYGRGMEIFNGTYHLLDMTPKGRDEDNLSFTMEWVRRRDQYEG